jgi:hypothetical protein
LPFATEAQIVQAPLTDLEQGRWLYKNELDIACCTTEAMRAGWQLEAAKTERWWKSQRRRVVDSGQIEHRHYEAQ